MAAAPAPLHDVVEVLPTAFDAHYAWRYESAADGLRDLYEKAKREQWTASTHLRWDTPVDPESEIIPQALNPLADWGPYKKLSPREEARFRHANLAWTLSQFLHGEQGALLTAAQLVDAVPWMDAKYYASTQTVDEARHVEVFHRYLHEKLEWEFPINVHLKRLLDAILTDSRWDLKYLGMQILVEGLAMAAFANMYQLAREPLIRELVHLVMRDESRHVAFGVLSLRDHYVDMAEPERRLREDFVVEACELMRDRLVGDDVAEVMGFDREAMRRVLLASPLMQQFRQLLFQRVVPNVKRLGLLTPRVRERFAALGIIQYEDADPESIDRQLGLVCAPPRGLLLGRLHREHRARSLLHHPLGHAAEQQVLEARVSARPDHDQIGVALARLVLDHARGVALADRELDAQAALAQARGVALEVLRGIRLHLRPEVRRQIGSLELLEVDREVVRVQQHQRALVLLREMRRPLEDGVGARREVDRDQDGADVDRHAASVPPPTHPAQGASPSPDPGTVRPDTG
jgi:hypothetical protein